MDVYKLVMSSGDTNMAPSGKPIFLILPRKSEVSRIYDLLSRTAPLRIVSRKIAA